MKNSRPPKLLKYKPLSRRQSRGAALIVALTFLSALLMMTSVFVSNVISSSNFQSSLEIETGSFYIAEAGLKRAIWKLSQFGNAYKGESNVTFGDGSFDVIVGDVPSKPAERTIVSEARLAGYAGNRSVQKIHATVTLQTSEHGAYRVTMKSWEQSD